MSEHGCDFLAEWHRIVAERDLAALREVLATDVSIGAPPYWQRLAGRELVHHLLEEIVAPQMTAFLANRARSS